MVLIGHNPSLELSVKRWSEENDVPLRIVRSPESLTFLPAEEVFLWVPEHCATSLPPVIAALAAKNRGMVCVPHGEIRYAQEALDAGFVSYLCLPVADVSLFEWLTRFARPRRATAGFTPPVPNQLTGEEFSDSEKGRALRENLERVAPYAVTVLLLGETGAGKEVAARLLHRMSPRAGGPFIPVHLSAMARDLIESELFGHVRGAFTSASRNRKGAFAQAHGGTLFIDEVGEIPLDIQVKLLRVLQSREYWPVGADAPVHSDCRIIAATNRDLASDVRRGRFRADLYYRLTAFPVVVPPLRERLDGLGTLANRLLDKINKELGTRVEGITEAALMRLRGHSWPGNVRELENVLQRAAIGAPGRQIDVLDLYFENLIPPQQTDERVEISLHTHELGEDFSLDATIRDIEEAIIRRAMEKSGGNVTDAARLLGIPRTTLHSKLLKRGIRPDEEPSVN